MCVSNFGAYRTSLYSPRTQKFINIKVIPYPAVPLKDILAFPHQPRWACSLASACACVRMLAHPRLCMCILHVYRCSPHCCWCSWCLLLCALLVLVLAQWCSLGVGLRDLCMSYPTWSFVNCCACMCQPCSLLNLHTSKPLIFNGSVGTCRRFEAA